MSYSSGGAIAAGLSDGINQGVQIASTIQSVKDRKQKREGREEEREYNAENRRTQSFGQAFTRSLVGDEAGAVEIMNKYRGEGQPKVQSFSIDRETRETIIGLDDGNSVSVPWEMANLALDGFDKGKFGKSQEKAIEPRNTTGVREALNEYSKIFELPDPYSETYQQDMKDLRKALAEGDDIERIGGALGAKRHPTYPLAAIDPAKRRKFAGMVAGHQEDGSYTEEEWAQNRSRKRQLTAEVPAGALTLPDALPDSGNKPDKLVPGYVDKESGMTYVGGDPTSPDSWEE